MEWKEFPREEPEYGKPVLTVIEHWNTKGRVPVVLRYVDEDDCCWRVVDGGKYESELSYDWNVVLWTSIPEF